MKRKWIIVEDDQAKWRAYVKAFLQIYGGVNPPFSDQVTFLVFREDDEREVNNHGSDLITSKCLKSRDDIADYIAAASNWKEGIVVLLDFLLNPPSLPVLQDKDNVVDNWKPIECRDGDDIICLLTSEYYGPDYLPHFSKKGALGDNAVPGGDAETRAKNAANNILKAHREWVARYDHPGKKLLHALMLAQPIGNAPGHILSRVEIYKGFPFGEALLEDEYCLSSFKALFYPVTEENVRRFDCGENTLVRIMLECGLGCDIVAKGEKKRIKLPLSPGALFLFRLCYLVRLLRDEKCENPVVKIEFYSTSDIFLTKLHFKQTVSELAEAFYNDGKGQTVPLLKTFERCCVPITPACDQALKRTFEVAASSTPPPNNDHVEKIRQMTPVLLDGRMLKVKFEEQVVLLEQVK